MDIGVKTLKKKNIFPLKVVMLSCYVDMIVRILTLETVMSLLTMVLSFQNVFSPNQNAKHLDYTPF